MLMAHMAGTLAKYGMYLQGWFIRCSKTKVTIATLYGRKLEQEKDDQVTLIAPELLCSEEQRTTLKTLGYLHDIQVEE